MMGNSLSQTGGSGSLGVSGSVAPFASAAGVEPKDSKTTAVTDQKSDAKATSVAAEQAARLQTIHDDILHKFFSITAKTPISGDGLIKGYNEIEYYKERVLELDRVAGEELNAEKPLDYIYLAIAGTIIPYLQDIDRKLLKAFKEKPVNEAHGYGADFLIFRLKLVEYRLQLIQAFLKEANLIGWNKFCKNQYYGMVVLEFEELFNALKDGNNNTPIQFEKLFNEALKRNTGNDTPILVEILKAYDCFYLGMFNVCRGPVPHKEDFSKEEAQFQAIFRLGGEFIERNKAVFAECYTGFTLVSKTAAESASAPHPRRTAINATAVMEIELQDIQEIMLNRSSAVAPVASAAAAMMRTSTAAIISYVDAKGVTGTINKAKAVSDVEKAKVAAVPVASASSATTTLSLAKK